MFLAKKKGIHLSYIFLLIPTFSSYFLRISSYFPHISSKFQNVCTPPTRGMAEILTLVPNQKFFPVPWIRGGGKREGPRIIGFWGVGITGNKTMKQVDINNTNATKSSGGDQ